MGARMCTASPKQHYERWVLVLANQVAKDRRELRRQNRRDCFSVEDRNVWQSLGMDFSMPMEISIDPEGDPEDKTTDPIANQLDTAELPLPTIEELPRVLDEPPRTVDQLRSDLELQASMVQRQFDSIPVQSVPLPTRARGEVLERGRPSTTAR